MDVERPKCPVCGVNKAKPDKSMCSSCRRRGGAAAVVQPEPEPDPVEDDGRVTSERMRRVMGTASKRDDSQTDRGLRQWWEKSPKEFIAAADAREKQERGEADLQKANERLLGEVEELRGRVTDLEMCSTKGETADEGSARARALIERILTEAGA